MWSRADAKGPGEALACLDPLPRRAEPSEADERSGGNEGAALRRRRLARRSSRGSREGGRTVASATPGAAREEEEGRGGGAGRGEAEGDEGVKGTIEESVEVTIG
jgi:hypothetical protein